MRGIASSRGRSKLLLRSALALVALWLLFSLLRMPLGPGARRAVLHEDHVVEESVPTTPRNVASNPPTLVVEHPPAHENVDTPAAGPNPTAAQSKGDDEGADVVNRNKVLAALQHTWKSYRQYAFPHDEFLPLSSSTRNWGNGKGIGVTMIDSLDTLLMAGLKDEAQEVIDWIDKTLSFHQDIKLSVFETTIRLLGGLISAYQMSGHESLKRQAVDLGKRLMKAFETPSGIPDNYVNCITGHHEGAGWNGGAAILSELGSLQMEFRALSDITGDPVYDRTAQKAITAIKGACNDGMCPRNFHGGAGSGGNAGLGSFGDSFYEYLLKYWILTGKTNTMYKEMWDKAASHIIRTSKRAGGHLVPNGEETGMTMEHLACFSGGLFALSYMHLGNKEHLTIAEEIANTCHDMYQSTTTKLSADVVHVNDGGFSISDGKYILRPETVETYFYLWRATKNEKYRKWGAEVMDACNEHLRVEKGYVGCTNVNGNPPPKNDMLETFWIAETLKYLLLLFSGDSAIDLQKMVFNTEAHPLKVAG